MTGPTTGTDMVDQEWKTEALCRQYDPEMFFPHRGDAAGVALAKRVCRVCPVVQECVDAAIARKERHGVWGGLTPMERVFRRRELAQQSGEGA